MGQKIFFVCLHYSPQQIALKTFHSGKKISRIIRDCRKFHSLLGILDFYLQTRITWNLRKPLQSSIVVHFTTAYWSFKHQNTLSERSHLLSIFYLQKNFQVISLLSTTNLYLRVSKQKLSCFVLS